MSVGVVHVYANDAVETKSTASVAQDVPNFAFGLGYGLLDRKSLMNIDFKVNIPINRYLSTQVLLNSNYLVTGSSSDSFAQSEFSSNWFLRNDYGRLGLGIGISEREPMDEELETERDIIGQFIGEAFLGDFSFTGNYISTDDTLSNVTSSRIGLGYYFNDDQRVSLFREKYNGEAMGWRLETHYQPKKYRQMGSMGLIARKGKDYNYVGAVVEYYFDYAVSLKQREREFH
ncbi:hypothetical protein HGG82_00235 [Marinomonas sp. M1K-6]|uniref:Cellulose synthase operon C C-terminal domain-containing protein n=2 Tax=Marinomonas profundi TaxID=2726122 RepID=A0A847R4Z2_9GAMM|nr:hypothetical protein [Marinomonas profundi]UDV04777.1 hypothetical protein J8N69_00765 [Marinomonas profundi]